MKAIALALVVFAAAPAVTPVARLGSEVRPLGFVVYSAVADGAWDLFVMRPDGSDRRNITRTADISEAGARFSPDGSKLLFYRMPRGTVLDNNRYGTYELVIADASGANPVVFGAGCPWASWAPGGRELACLAKDGVVFVDLASKQVKRKLDRKGIVEQLFLSSDGKWLTGTANGLGQHWAIARMAVPGGALNRVSDGDCFNCTPDFFPDGRSIIYSRGHPCTDGFAQLWMADADGTTRRMIYGEIGRHIYGGGLSPDGKYVVFTRSRADLGKVDNSVTTMALMRFADAPVVGGDSVVLRQKYPKAKDGPVLDLGPGWEPHWTFAETAAAR